MLALTLLAVDPGRLKGLWLRARAGPVRDRFLEQLGALKLSLRMIHPAITDEALYGGLDLAGTLATGTFRSRPGLLDRPGTLILTMAERCDATLAAKLSRALDTPGFSLVALDEGEEGLPDGLLDRIGLFVDLDAISWRDCQTGCVALPAVAKAAARLAEVATDEVFLTETTATAARLGIDSLRAPMLCLAAARAHASVCGNTAVTMDDLVPAVELTLSHKSAVSLDTPPDAIDDPVPDASAPDEQKTQDGPGGHPDLPSEILLEAARAALPADLLARIAAGRGPRRAQASTGSGGTQKGNRRGRPLPARPGRLDGSARIDLVATLRAAAPWQTIRKATSPPGQKLAIRASDIRIRRFEEKSDRLLVFAVDASGSAAVARLAEAKGAVELLLAEAYARRDHVALIEFRGDKAELLLPPTRSLVQAKKRLASMPGGGGTPMAAGLVAALELAELAKARGMTPTIAVLTDGRANVALDGTADRVAAKADAENLARRISGTGVTALIIDAGQRPHPALRDLAALMKALYVPLPRAESGGLSRAITTAQGM